MFTLAVNQMFTNGNPMNLSEKTKEALWGIAALAMFSALVADIFINMTQVPQ